MAPLLLEEVDQARLTSWLPLDRRVPLVLRRDERRPASRERHHAEAGVLALIVEWASLHEAELLANWDRCRRKDALGEFAKAYVHPDADTVAWPGDLDLDPDVLYARAHSIPIPEE